MNRLSYFQIQTKYGGEFIAQRNNKVVAHAKDIEKLYKRIGSKKIKRDGHTTVGFVPRKDACYVF